MREFASIATRTVATVLLLSSGCASAAPAQVENPVTEIKERVYSDSTVAGKEIFFQDGTGTPVPLTFNSVDDLDPHLAHSEFGTTFVTYWREDADGPRVYVRTRAARSEDWTPEVALSSPDLRSRYPASVVFDQVVHLGVEATTPEGEQGIALFPIGESTECIDGDCDDNCAGPLCDSSELCDDPNDLNCPLAWQELEFVTDRGKPRFKLLVEGEKLWAGWLVSEDRVEYAVWDSRAGVWGPPRYVPLAGDFEATIEQIRRNLFR